MTTERTPERTKSPPPFCAPAGQTAPAWIAWRKPQGGRWQPVAEGATEREASDRLFEVMDRDRSGSFSSVILPTGERP